ncbi:MAG: glycosyltransferase family 4 protein [Oligoflexales bacterium]
MKIAFVVQRYGEDVLGGAENQARFVAERLVRQGLDVTVLTTTSKDHLKWDDFFPAGHSTLNGVKIQRFLVTKRKQFFFKLYHHGVRFFLKRHRFFDGFKPLVQAIDALWFVLQGPVMQGLSPILKDYDCLFFFTYLYAPTVFGLPQVYEKAVLVPEAHDEDPFYFPSIASLFQYSKYVFFNTNAERDLATGCGYLFSSQSWVVGCGVDIEERCLQTSVKPGQKRSRKFLLFMGRFDEKKGVSKLLSFYQSYRDLANDPLDLVMIGDGVEKLGHEIPGVKTLGFVSAETRNGLLAEAQAVVSFSQQESLSLVVLEALSVGTPVLLGATCQVFEDYSKQVPLVRLCRTADIFCAEVQGLHSSFSKEQILFSQEWVQKNYGWNRVLEMYKTLAKHCMNVAG